MKQLAILLGVILLSQSSLAQDKRFNVYKENSAKRAVIKNTRDLSVYYEKLSWNENPNKIDSGYLYLRDKISNELIELKLTETEPNSAIFNIDFPKGVIKQNNVAAEVYSAPQAMLKGNNRMEIMKKLIADGSVKRKPFLLRVLRQRGQVVDVFDDKEKALASYNKYKEQMGLQAKSNESDSIIEVTNTEKPARKKVIDTSTLQSMFLANETDQESTNEKNREMREVLKNMETERRDKVMSNSKGWGPNKTRSNALKAKGLIKDGISQLKKQKFDESMNSFFKASDFYPSNQDIYQQYGVSLFRNKKFNQSIVVLGLSNPSSKRMGEKEFYLGMNYYQLKDYQSAVEHFDKVVQSGDKTFQVTAAFYKGMSLIELGKYEEAKKSFQYVLDNSTDPKMDERAEKYIEYAIDRENLEKKRSNWLFIDGVVGLIYDSNIILALDQARAQGDVTDEAGMRVLGQVSVKARPYYEENNELAVAMDFTGLMSFDEGFGSNPSAETADPYLVGLRVPWTHRTTLDGKAYFFDLYPSFENIAMDLEGKGKTTITNSYKVSWDNTLVLNNRWIAKGDWFFASNDSNITTETDRDVADSTSGGLTLSAIYILNKDFERYLIPEFGVQVNDAKGEDYSFQRVDLGLTFTTAIFGGFMWNSRLGYYLANYESNRSDNNWTITTGTSTRISSHWNWGLSASFIRNDSNTNPYDKFNVASTFSFSY